MAAPARFPSGVTNVSPTADTAQLPVPDPSSIHMYWNDFDVYNADDWTVTATGTSPVALADADGGVLTITTGSTENDGDFLEAEGESFLLEAGKKAWVKARFKCNDVTQSDIIIGLHSTDTTPQDATLRFLFESVDGSANMYFNIDDNTTDSDSTAFTLVDDTWVVVCAYYDGKGNVEIWVDGTKRSTMTSVGLPGAEMAIGFGCLTGEAAAQTFSLDYLLVAKER